jgi:hypothetical protein
MTLDNLAERFVEAVGKTQEEGVMSTIANFPSVRSQGLINQ